MDTIPETSITTGSVIDASDRWSQHTFVAPEVAELSADDSGINVSSWSKSKTIAVVVAVVVTVTLGAGARMFFPIGADHYNQYILKVM